MKTLLKSVLVLLVSATFALAAEKIGMAVGSGASKGDARANAEQHITRNYDYRIVDVRYTEANGRVSCVITYKYKM